MSILPYLACALLYAALGFHFWRTRISASDAPPPDSRAAVWEKATVAAALTLHAWLLHGTLVGPGGFYRGLANAVSAIVFLAVLIYWIGGFAHRVEGLHALVLPVAACACLLPLLLPPIQPLPNTERFAFKAHLLVSMLAYSLLTIASLHVLLMSIMEKRLHGGGLAGGMERLPPLLTMEALLFQMIGAGFVLLTLTVASGVFFSEELFGRALRFNHKTVFGLISWTIFGALLVGRVAYGWRGRTALRWTLAGFLALVLAYIGSRFVLEVVLNRA